MNDEDPPVEVTLPPFFEADAAGARTQIGGRPAQRLSDESRKVVLALFGALDLKVSMDVRAEVFHGGTALGVLNEFREMVECFDEQFALLLTPDNTAAAQRGGGGIA